MTYTIPCETCGGSGVRREYAHMDNGVCYKCEGSGKRKATKKQYESYLSNALATQTLENEEQKKVAKTAVLRKKTFYIYDAEDMPLTGHYGEPTQAIVHGNDATGFYTLLKGIKRYIVPVFNGENQIEKWKVR